MRWLFAVASIILMSASAQAAAPRLSIRNVDRKSPEGFVRINGVGADAFDPSDWTDGPPFSLPDIRWPLVEPRAGNYRNIYAPSIVQLEKGWQIFFGGWDGVATGNDRIYSVTTADFERFHDRRTIIEHGEFHHICNVSALRLKTGGFLKTDGFLMACTGLLDPGGLNKPVLFTSSDGETWNGDRSPHPAAREDLLDLRGYDRFETADINGMNVLLYAEGRFHLYFCNFKDPGHVYRASSIDGRQFGFEGPVLKNTMFVNDVKSLVDARGRIFYLMALHQNTGHLEYAISSGLARFAEPKVLVERRGEGDQFIVAVGWVVEAKPQQAGTRVLGFLYGAGAKPSLDANRIFARWFQKRVVFECEDGSVIEPSAALGPDAQLVPITEQHLRGRFTLIGADGQPMSSGTIVVSPGKTYEILP